MAAETVAILGTGIMGAPMARNLLRAGFAVRAWNRTRAKVQPLVDEGAVAAATPAEAAQGATVLLTMLADGPAVDQAVVQGGVLKALSRGVDPDRRAAPESGPDAPGGTPPVRGVAEPRPEATGSGQGALWLECSTVGVGDVEYLGKLAARAGVAFVDAPVLGTRQPAEEGRLTVFASGPEEVRERAQRVLEAVAQRVDWVGPAGAGTRLKLVVNNWLHALLGSLAETIAFARALDVDPRQFLQAIEGGPIGAPYAQLKGAAMLAGEYPTSFSLRLATKDVRLVLDAAGRRGLDLPIAEAVVARYGQAVELGHGDEDMASVYEAAQRPLSNSSGSDLATESRSAPSATPGT